LSLKKDILAAIAYFDLFNYPITQTEIFLFLRNTYCHSEFNSQMVKLVNRGLIYQLDEFYSLQKDFSLIERRRTGNQKAKKLLQTADSAAHLLSKFPYVRGVAVSGSLSKNFADDDSDIDFFIITEKNRLWIARTILHCFKKLTFLRNKQHLFCMNYFVDEAFLEIKEKNIYTAIEIATLKPLRGINAFQHFYEHNKWTRTYLPNHSLKISYVKEQQKPFLIRAVEVCFNNVIGDLLDKLFLYITAARWAKKEKRSQKNAHGITMSMQASRHCAKPNPVYFQNKLIVQYEHKLFNLSYRTEALLKPVY
jgi:hypothetical protein